jgi:hypothetical protein
MSDPNIENTFPPLLVKLKTAGHLLDCGETKIRELIDEGELDSGLDDGVRKVSWESIVRRATKVLATKETDRAKTAAAVKASLKLARERRWEKARQMARRARQIANASARGAGSSPQSPLSPQSPPSP